MGWHEGLWACILVYIKGLEVKGWMEMQKKKKKKKKIVCEKEEKSWNIEPNDQTNSSLKKLNKKCNKK